MPVDFVNIHGKPWNPSHEAVTPKPKVKTEAPSEFHKGWLVKGVPPGALKQAQDAHNREAATARTNGKAADDFDVDSWLGKARVKRVRSKPYEAEGGATACKALAEKAGWLRVRVVESKKDSGKPDAAGTWAPRHPSAFSGLC